MSQVYVQLHGLSSNMKEGSREGERGRERERERKRERERGAEGAEGREGEVNDGQIRFGEEHMVSKDHN